MSDNSFYLPQYLDEPPRFLLWTMDEALAFFLPLFIAMIFNHPSLGLGLGVFAMIGLKKFKSKLGNGHYKRWLYWHFPYALYLRATPSALIREYLG